MNYIDVRTLVIPRLEKKVYSAVCCAVWYLNQDAPLDRAVRRASAKHEVPMAEIERNLRAGLPANYFIKRQKLKTKRNPILAKTEAVMMKHMANL